MKKKNWLKMRVFSVVLIIGVILCSFASDGESGNDGGTGDCYSTINVDCPVIIGGQEITCQYNGTFGGKLACQTYSCIGVKDCYKCVKVQGTPGYTKWTYGKVTCD